MNQFLTSQGYGLQYTIGKINVYSILTKDIWVLKTAYFSPASGQAFVRAVYDKKKNCKYFLGNSVIQKWLANTKMS